MAVRAAVGMNLGPDDARFEPGDLVPDAEKRLGKAAYRQWVSDGLLVEDGPQTGRSGALPADTKDGE